MRNDAEASGVFGVPTFVFEGELSRAAVPERWMGWVIILCGTLQLGGIGVFFHTMWGRIRPVGSAQREARGERF